MSGIAQNGFAAQAKLARRIPRAANMNFFYVNSVWGVLVLAADVWGIINVFQSSASNEKKALWIVLIVLLPVLGVILWFFLGPRGPGLRST